MFISAQQDNRNTIFDEEDNFISQMELEYEERYQREMDQMMEEEFCFQATNEPSFDDQED